MLFVSFAFFPCPVAVSMGTDLLRGVNGNPRSAKWKTVSMCLLENYSFAEKVDGRCMCERSVRW